MPDIAKGFTDNTDLANTLWDMSPIVIAMIDEEGRFLCVNQMAQHFWEYTEAELRQKRWQDITHPEDLPADVSMHKMLRDKKQQQYTMCKRYITKSGRVVWGSLTVHTLNDTGGRFLYFLSQVIPIDNYIHEKNEIQKTISAQEVTKDGGSKVSFSGYIMKNLPSLVSLLFVLIGGVYVFSADFGANKQKMNDMENDIKRIEVKVHDSNKSTQKKMEEITKLLIEIKSAKGGKK